MPLALEPCGARSFLRILALDDVWPLRDNHLQTSSGFFNHFQRKHLWL
jgi:hypothetical protein